MASLEYATIKSYGEHHHLCEVSVYKNGAYFKEKIPLSSVQFKVDGHELTGRQIYENMKRIEKLEARLERVAQATQEFVDRFYELEKERGEIL